MAQSILLNTDQLIQKNCTGRVQIRKSYMDKFSVRRRATFLDHLAATCNVKIAAERSGVSPTAAYQWRRRDALFAEQWQAALEAGYTCLETMLLARARGMTELPEGEVAVPDPAKMDTDLAIRLLGHHRRGVSGEKRAGGKMLSRASEDETNDAIIKQLRALRLRMEKGVK
jgi:hypothetical protein